MCSGRDLGVGEGCLEGILALEAFDFSITDLFSIRNMRSNWLRYPGQVRFARVHWLHDGVALSHCAMSETLRGSIAKTLHLATTGMHAENGSYREPLEGE